MQNTDALAQIRNRMTKDGVDVLVVRATDGYLNEYVADDASTRVWLTGFTGSTGDAVITHTDAHLVVDGRYALQVKNQSPSYTAHVTPLGVSIETGVLGVVKELAARKAGSIVGVEASKVSALLQKSLVERAAADGYSWRWLSPLRDVAPPTGTWMTVSPALVGRTVAARLQEGFTHASLKDVDALLLCALDELAWTTNLRGAFFPYQATFPAVGLVTRDRAIIVTTSVVPDDIAKKIEAPVHIAKTLAEALGLLGANTRLGIDPSTTPASVLADIVVHKVTTTQVASPFAMMRTEKTSHELAHMTKAFARADGVVDGVQKWVARQLKKNMKITERDVARETEAGFRASGAWGLSFNVISAAGKNGAFIHYGTPDDKTPLKKGDLFLLDTGAYYEGGYATDLTRTFLLGPSQIKAKKDQKVLYTLVLKGAIAGMSARLPTTATGGQLDALVRAPLWAAGYDYGHGTGHGVGVNVHEGPPRISVGSTVPLRVGQVFSIEPGVYIEGWGGIRIENLCTVVLDTPAKTSKLPAYTGKTFLRVQPLTFSPLDERLIDRTLLTPHEKRFLAWFKRKNPKLLPPTM
jgi:Xaa-Pro aminopeptidase